jgi:hypothetical protein
MPKYVGPSDIFCLEEGGKEYHIGDNIPLTKEQVAHHEAIGHRFDSTPDVPATIPVEVNVVEPAPPVHAVARTPVQAPAAYADVEKIK